MGEFYDSEAWRAFALGHPGGAAATRRLFTRAALPKGARVLDLCCGAGDSAALARDLGFHAIGADREAVILRARARYPALDFYAWDGGALPFEAATLGAVLCECSLSQLGDAAAILAELRRALAPGGRLLLSDVYARDGGAPKLPGFRALWFEDAARDLRDFAAQWLWDTGTRFPYDGDIHKMSYYYAVYALEE
jgi:ubiquinone/menaquinone biosynthesis C-methylase UbiE